MYVNTLGDKVRTSGSVMLWKHFVGVLWVHLSCNIQESEHIKKSLKLFLLVISNSIIKTFITFLSLNQGYKNDVNRLG